MLLQGKSSCSEGSLSHIPHTLLAVGASETSRKQEQVLLQVMINYVEDQPSKLHPPALPVSSLLFLPRFLCCWDCSQGNPAGRPAEGTKAHREPHAAQSDASAAGMMGTDKCTLYFLRYSWQQASKRCSHPPAPRSDPVGHRSIS